MNLCDYMREGERVCVGLCMLRGRDKNKLKSRAWEQQGCETVFPQLEIQAPVRASPFLTVTEMEPPHQKAELLATAASILHPKGWPGIPPLKCLYFLHHH